MVKIQYFFSLELFAVLYIYFLSFWWKSIHSQDLYKYIFHTHLFLFQLVLLFTPKCLLSTHEISSFIFLNTLLTFKLKIIFIFKFHFFWSECIPNFFYLIGISHVNSPNMFVREFANSLSRTFFFHFSCAQISLTNGFWYCLYVIPENRSTKENTIKHWFLSTDAVCKPVDGLAKILAVRILFQHAQINPRPGLSLQLFSCYPFMGGWLLPTFLFKALVLVHVLCTISLCCLLGFEFLAALVCCLSQVSQVSQPHLLTTLYLCLMPVSDFNLLFKYDQIFYQFWDCQGSILISRCISNLDIE